MRTSLAGPNPARYIEVTLLLPAPRPHAAAAHSASPEELGTKLPHQRHYLAREGFASSHGAAPSDLQAVAQFALESGLRVVGQNVAGRTVHLSGTIANFAKAFHVELSPHFPPCGWFVPRTGGIGQRPRIARERSPGCVRSRQSARSEAPLPTETGAWWCSASFAGRDIFAR